MLKSLRLFWKRVRYFMEPPATMRPGETPTPQKFRPIPIELGFMLHADGTVYHRSRKNHGDVRVDEKFNVIDHVHLEYAHLTELARKHHRAQMIKHRLNTLIGRKEQS